MNGNLINFKVNFKHLCTEGLSYFLAFAVLLSHLFLFTGVARADEILPNLPNFKDHTERYDSYESSVIDSDHAAFLFVKHRMLHRRPAIKLELTPEYTNNVKSRFSDMNSYAEDIVDRVQTLNGIPKEGDYLRDSYNFSSVSYSERDGKLFIELSFSFYVDYQKELEVDDYVAQLLGPSGELAAINTPHVSDFDKVRTIFYWIVNRSTYDYSPRPDHSAYAGFIKRKTVCDGFASMFYRLCAELGVESRILLGMYGTDQHAWNIVKLGDKWYHLDVTGSLGTKEDDKSTSLFLWESGPAPDFTFYDHIRNPKYKTETFDALHPMSSTRYNFIMQDVKNPANKGKLRYPSGGGNIDSGVTQRNSGYAGNNVRWEYVDGHLQVYGFGEMFDYEDATQVPWQAYAANITSIEVEDGITHVGKNAFASTSLRVGDPKAIFDTGIASYGENYLSGAEARTVKDKPTMASIYRPFLRDYVALDVGDEPVEAASLLINKWNDRYSGIKLPQGTEVVYINSFTTDEAGKKSAKIRVTYPDGSSSDFDYFNIYVRDNTYNGKPVRIKIVAEPQRTRYIKGVETFEAAGMVLSLIDEQGNYVNIGADEFAAYNVKLYADSACTEELTSTTPVKNNQVFVKLGDLQTSLLITVEDDGNYVAPRGTRLEWERNKPFNEPALLVENRHSLPKNTVYTVVDAENSSNPQVVDTSALGEKQVTIMVQYPDNSKRWVTATLNIVEAATVTSTTESETTATTTESTTAPTTTTPTTEATTTATTTVEPTSTATTTVAATTTTAPTTEATTTATTTAESTTTATTEATTTVTEPATTTTTTVEPTTTATTESETTATTTVEATTTTVEPTSTATTTVAATTTTAPTTEATTTATTTTEPTTTAPTTTPKSTGAATTTTVGTTTTTGVTISRPTSERTSRTTAPAAVTKVPTTAANTVRTAQQTLKGANIVVKRSETVQQPFKQAVSKTGEVGNKQTSFAVLLFAALVLSVSFLSKKETRNRNN